MEQEFTATALEQELIEIDIRFAKLKASLESLKVSKKLTQDIALESQVIFNDSKMPEVFFSGKTEAQKYKAALEEHNEGLSALITGALAVLIIIILRAITWMKRSGGGSGGGGGGGSSGSTFHFEYKYQESKSTLFELLEKLKSFLNNPNHKNNTHFMAFSTNAAVVAGFINEGLLTHFNACARETDYLNDTIKKGVTDLTNMEAAFEKLESGVYMLAARGELTEEKVNNEAWPQYNQINTECEKVSEKLSKTIKTAADFNDAYLKTKEDGFNASNFNKMSILITKFDATAAALDAKLQKLNSDYETIYKTLESLAESLERFKKKIADAVDKANKSKQLLLAAPGNDSSTVSDNTNDDQYRMAKEVVINAGKMFANNADTISKQAVMSATKLKTVLSRPYADMGHASTALRALLMHVASVY